jgi:Bromodomain
MQQEHDWESRVEMVLKKVMTRKDSEVFREPVPYEELGLVDYIDAIKNRPMDLGTVSKKLASRSYKNINECAADVRLIWFNAMLYNQPNSHIYKLAKNLSDVWEDSFSLVRPDDEDRAPTTEEMNLWVAECHRLSPEDLGSLLQKLEVFAPESIIKRPTSNDVEINVDLIGGRYLRMVTSLFLYYYLFIYLWSRT